jgi:septal ring factor EnvC (AmiA/AmiB activator)
MAECLTCKKALQGSWNMTAASTPYEKTGRYLGITDGYFLYSEGPNWVHCYCTTCWQKAILTLPFIPTVKQVNILQQQLSASQRTQTNLQQQLNASRQNEINLQQQLSASQQTQTNLQQQLSTAQNESATYKKQLEEMSEKYNKLSNISGIEELRDLLKHLTSSQIDTLHTHTQFWVDTFETMDDEQQFQCSSQFVQ